LSNVSGERIRAITLNIKELKREMAILRRTGMELADSDPEIQPGGLN